MRRRDFITCLGLAFVWPGRARAPQPDRVRRIGVLLPYAENDDEAKSHLSALTREFKRLGWSQDRRQAGDPKHATCNLTGSVRVHKRQIRWTATFITLGLTAGSGEIIYSASGSQKGAVDFVLKLPEARFYVQA
jgi:hypothetical protein